MMKLNNTIAVAISTIGTLLLLTSCSTTDPYAGSYQDKNDNVGLYYSQLEKNLKSYEGPARNPVIVIHGFLGAKLKDTDNGNIVWGTFNASDIIRGYSDKYLQELSYPMISGKNLSDIKDYVIPYSMMADASINVIGIQFKRSAYQDMLDILISKGFIPEDKLEEKGKKFPSLFRFYYDWRRNNVQNAEQLHKFIQEKRVFLQKKYEDIYGIKNFDVKFNIIGHSMGGIITRYYLMYGDQKIPEVGPLPKPDWRGTEHIERVIIVGTPNLGFLNTLFELTKGLKIESEMPPLPPATVGTWATYYQMLPFHCTNSVKYADNPDGPGINLYDPQVWKDLKWGLADPNQDKYLEILLPETKTPEERRKIAIDHLTKCLKKAEKFAQALLANSQQPNDLGLFLFLGDSVETRKFAVVDRETGELKVTILDGGDGVVLTTSARMDTVKSKPWQPFQSSNVDWHSVVHLNAAHMGITETCGFGDNVTYYLMLLKLKGDKKRKSYLKKILNESDKYMQYFKNYNTDNQ